MLTVLHLRRRTKLNKTKRSRVGSRSNSQAILHKYMADMLCFNHFFFVPGSCRLSIHGASRLSKFLSSGLTTSVTGDFSCAALGGKLEPLPCLVSTPKVLPPGLVIGAFPLSTGAAEPSLCAVDSGAS